MILRREGEAIGLDRDFAIYDDADQVDLIKRGMKELEIDPKRFAPRAVLSAISSAKSELIGTEGFGSRRETYFDEVVLRVYERYQELLTQSSAVDFDDLLFRTHSLFDRFSEVADKYQNRYVHFMIDEFQDTNVAQYAIAKQLTKAHRNLCVVGDPDQSIYSWRNADIRNILSFQQDYPESKVIALEENYRSTQTILDAARKVIVPNTQRVEKDLWTSNGKGVPIVVNEGYNEQEEAQFVLSEIQNLTGQGLRNNGKATCALGDVAVMYRVNAQSRALEEACLRYGMPYQVVGGLKFYQRQEVKDVAAYLRLIANPRDDVALARVINVPARGIGQRTLDELTRMARAAETSMFDAIGQIATAKAEGSELPFTPRAAKSLIDFRALIDGLTEQRNSVNLVELIELVFERSGYKRHLQESADRGEERLENIQEFRNAARDFLELGDEEALTAFLENVSLVSDIDSFEQKPDAVTLITLHQAKGLEFRVVFIVGMEEGLLPHQRSIDTGDPAELEEERRLFYVGITRAMEKLYLLRAFRRGFRGGSMPGIPSRFLADIPPELIVAPPRAGSRPNASAGWTPSSVGPRRTARKAATSDSAPVSTAPAVATGDKVRHAKFGDGMVMACDPSGEDYQVTVVFGEEHGIKRLLLSFANLEKV
jgi:DNA helicase-2/ATP-dependent DNA helicase PcrA